MKLRAVSLPTLPGGRVDKGILIYLLALSIAVLIRQPIGVWVPVLAVHGAVAAGILGLSWAFTVRPSGVIHFLYRWYPLLCFLLFFEEVGRLVHFIQPGWFDRYLITLDYRLFGVHPTVWLEQYAKPWLTEVMQGSYFSYYLMIPAVGGLLYYRKQWRDFETLMLAAVLGYSTCYVIFYLFPVEGPYHTLAALQQVQLTGGFFTAVMELVERLGRVHGGAFPSAHVVGTIVPWLVAWKYTRNLAWGMTPLVIALLISTVYGRYHYVTDVLAGIVVAVLACAAGVGIRGTDHSSES